MPIEVPKIIVCSKCKIMDFVRDRQNPRKKPAIFTKDQIDPAFMKQLLEIETKLMQDQINYINIIDDRIGTDITDEDQQLRVTTATEWIKHTGMKKLTDGQQIIA